MADGFQPAGRAAAPAPLDLVQDFVNTEIPEWERDDLGDPTALGAWLRARALVGPGGATPSRADLERAHALRRALRLLARVNTTQDPLGSREAAFVEEAVSALPVALAAEARGIVLRPLGGDVPAALAAIAAIALEARLSGSWQRLKACRKESCGWVFYDGSRNRSSSWCSMSICGNRVKARRARGRRREARS